MNISLAFRTPKELDAWWRHQIETFSALLATCAGNSPVTGEFPVQRPVIINSWVNNRGAGGLRRHRAHYDVTVMDWLLFANFHKMTDNRLKLYIMLSLGFFFSWYVHWLEQRYETMEEYKKFDSIKTLCNLTSQSLLWNCDTMSMLFVCLDARKQITRNWFH